MTDLERLFRRLVDNLIAIDPARLHRPLALGDLLGSVIPYRTNRRSLQIDSVEDYEMLVLRLAAGEGGFVRLASDDVAQVFRDQLESPNPDLEVLREHAKAELFLGTEPLAHALGPGPEEAYAPPEEEFDFPSVIPIDAARTPVPAPARGEPPNRRAATEPPPGARERDPGARESFRAEPPSLTAEVWRIEDARIAAGAGATEVALDVFLRHPTPPVSRVRKLAARSSVCITTCMS